MNRFMILNFAAVLFLIGAIHAGTISIANGQIVGGTVSSVTNTVNSTVSSVTSTVGGTTSGTVGVVNQTTSPVVNSTLSTNVTDTTGSVSVGNTLGIPLPNLTIPVSASSSVAGVQAFGNGTLVTSINGVSMSFFFDPQGPRGVHSGSNGGTATDPPLVVKSDDLGGNEITGMYMELQNSKGRDISTAYSPAKFTVTSGKNYIVYANDYQNFVFDHWDDGSNDPARSITPTQPMTLVAYYSTGGTATVPTPPSNLSANVISSSQIDLAWNAPQSNGGSAITGYKVERSGDGGANWSTVSQNTGNTSTIYSDKGLQAGTTYSYRVSAINSAGTSNPSNTASGKTYPTLNSTINKVQTGLVASDMLTNETRTQQQLLANKGYWNYDGDAPNENATYGFSRDGTGLHIGVQAPADGTWAGFFAESPNHAAKLWSALVSNSVSTTQNEFYENGLYVQTANGSINYVTCSTFTNPQATVWGVINATGNTNQVTSYDVLWLDRSPNQPLTRDCSIVTDGNHLLKVYLDGSKVYEEDNGNLQMPSPFNAYLEPESSDGSEFLVGTYSNYYVTTDEKIQVTQLPGNAARVDLSQGSKVLASGSVSGGVATIHVGQFAFPLSSTIQVYDSNNNLIASNLESIYGGDIYSVSTTGNATPVPPTNLQADGRNNMVSLSWQVPSSNGGSPITNYKIYRSASSGTETLLAQIGNVTAYNDTSVGPGQTYFYRVTASNSFGESSPSNEASATTMTSVTAPLAPVGLVATAASSSEINLSWAAPSSDGGSPITGYKIERSANGGSTWSLIVPDTALTSTTYSDAGLAAGKAYEYRVSAINSLGTSLPSNVANVTTLATFPSSPTGLVATSVSSLEVDLTWNPPGWNGGSAITGYMIQRSTDGGATWSTVVADTATTTTSYQDKGVQPGMTYEYQVFAINSVGKSSHSNIVSAST
ncbi:MAG TPA: fibronectin type III domain-containing protein [Candidatus Nitrosotalea sp.]|nr:fibronectin type III domain-containing protein [Candidatus Nitrosotalea sp.]